MDNKRKNNQKGFTLVELIIVIAILGVLAALLVPRIMGNVQDANRNKHISNARTIASEITVYNAGEATKGGTLFGVGTTLEKGDLTPGAGVPASIAIADDEFPDESIVKIKIDADGNASIEIQSTP